MHTSKSEPKPEDPQKSEGKIISQETEEEYDARLEREEQARVANAKRKELERIQRIHGSTNSTQGVRFKGILIGRPFGMQHLIFSHCLIVGRGRMKFVDPELHHRQ